MKIKNRQLLALSASFALALSIGLTSCKKDKDDNNSGAALSATLKGSAYNPSTVSAYTLNSDIYVTGARITATDSSMLMVSFADTCKVNTKYNYDNQVDVIYYDYKKGTNYGQWSSSAHANVTITTFDKTNKKIAGNFNGVLYNWFNDKDSIVVTNGQFNTTYK